MNSDIPERLAELWLRNYPSSGLSKESIRNHIKRFLPGGSRATSIQFGRQSGKTEAARIMYEELISLNMLAAKAGGAVTTNKKRNEEVL